MASSLENIESELSCLVESCACTIVRLQWINTGKIKTLQLMIEKIDGSAVTANDCENVGRVVSVKLDILDPFTERYSLEVSSTGVDRPLTKFSDFIRFCGKYVVVKTYASKTGTKTFKGLLESATENGIKLRLDAQLQGGIEVLELYYDEISNAHIDGFRS
jgi:ribosome maturation factor RimP